MRLSVRRHLAAAVCSVLHRVLPRGLQTWGWAICNEVAEIRNDSEALRFALESLWGLAPRAIAMHLNCLLGRFSGSGTMPRGGMMDMRLLEGIAARPQAVGIASAIGAVMLGLAYMLIAGAPIEYLAINGGALAVGLAVLTLLGRAKTDTVQRSGMATMAMALILLATALLGSRVEGAARWVDLGALFVQPSLVLLPFMIVGFVRSRNTLSTAGLLVAAAALAIQPDRAMAGMLVAGVTTLAVFQPDRFVVTTLIGSAVGFTATLAQADTLPAMPFVDQILYSSFDVSIITGLAVLGGTVLLVVPAAIGWMYDIDNRKIYGAFGAVWIASIAAAALGNYPTPVVGYSGGAILGYVLSLILLPKIARLSLETRLVTGPQNGDAESNDRNLRFAASCPA